MSGPVKEVLCIFCVKAAQVVIRPTFQFNSLAYRDSMALTLELDESSGNKTSEIFFFSSSVQAETSKLCDHPPLLRGKQVCVHINSR